jgi:adenylate kinase
MEQTQPLIDYYGDKGLLLDVDGTLEISTVFELITEALDN